MAVRRSSDLDKPAQFYIPNNFIDSGTLLGGMVKVRNASEALIVLLVLGYPIFLLPIGLKTKITILAIIGLPIAILALVGLNDGPLSTFIGDYFSYLKQNKNVVYYGKDGVDSTKSHNKDKKTNN